MNSNEILQDDLRKLLDALDLGTHARPATPHEVFQECIREVYRLKAAQPQNILDRLDAAQTTLKDAARLLTDYYVAPIANGKVAVLDGPVPMEASFLSHGDYTPAR